MSARFTVSEAEPHAQLVPSLGLPCIAFRVALNDGIWKVVSEPPDAESFATRIGRYGLPIMFPWPNRIRDGRFPFDERAYEMPIVGRGPHAIHGLTRERPWTAEKAGTDARGAFCRASVTVGNAPDDPWPFPSKLNGRTLGNLPLLWTCRGRFPTADRLH